MQERARVTRQEVLSAAAEIFEAKGFHATTINDIVHRAGVTRGALYFHFPSKESLVEAVIAEQEHWRLTQPPHSGSHLQGLINLSYRFAHALQHDIFVRASIRLTLECSTFATHDSTPYTQWVHSVHTTLTAAADAGELLPDLDLDRVSSLLAGAVTGIQLLSEATAGRRDLPDLVEQLWNLTLPGLAHPAVINTLTYGSARPHSTDPDEVSTHPAKAAPAPAPSSARESSWRDPFLHTCSHM